MCMRAPRGVVLCLVRIQCLFFIAERNGPRREAVGASENSRMKRSSRERVGLFLDANNARAEVFFFSRANVIFRVDTRETHFYDGFDSLFVGTQGGSVVEVEGSFDGWQTRTQLHRSGNREFSVIKSFPPGVYQYKFIVDGEWKYAPDQPAMYDELGNVNNVLEVQEYVPEILDNLDHFAQPSSPKESYDDYLFHGEDFSKEPPAVPPQLKLTLLNMPPIPFAPNLLPRPQHVVLNHAYVDQSKAKQGLSVIGTTHRYRAKYVTIVLMKSSNPESC